VIAEAVPPQNLDAEESLLSAIMLGGGDGPEASAATIADVRATGLEPGDFYLPSHGLIYQAALAVHERGEPTTVIAVEAELRSEGKLRAARGKRRLHELSILAPARTNAAHFARQVVEAADRREQVNVGLALRAAGENAGLSADTALQERLARLLRRPASAPAKAAPWHSQSWCEFRDSSEDEHRWLVHGLLPAGMLAFVAGPPKKGKTWLGLGLALVIATGRPLFGDYEVPEARNVLYVALEGSRVGLRARIGALARGLDLDPDGEDVDRLTMLYRPRPFDLADLATATWLHHEAENVDAALVVVDVLRAAARFKENVAEDFALVRDGLEPLLNAGRTVALLHHFGKLSETQKERSPGERMAGTGAMYGALDVGLLITRSESGARRLRVDVEARDFAAPEALGVVIGGTGSGEHAGSPIRMPRHSISIRQPPRSATSRRRSKRSSATASGAPSRKSPRRRAASEPTRTTSAKR
jgi:AAA domain/DnaB-like helicase N terminal domain